MTIVHRCSRRYCRNSWSLRQTTRNEAAARTITTPDHPIAIEWDYPGEPHHPHEEAEQQYPQGFREGITAVWQAGEQDEGYRQGNETQGLDGERPGNEVDHVGLTTVMECTAILSIKTDASA